ncbi:regulation of nuclear pre-mRNA domain-containing protein 1B [Iris pallida]|uniref:Regulation of nuclear pre-mRNA domain-containing protein 1B n=1 Tax=Iris pallida TaxID=29817 RepID=A0AAX6HWG4_IRIPA|nr:regulation of nuclear pre-mRNA domain-containing protein 1B [Iris pallida]
MDGNGIFNAHILVDKLAKLNNSQQSIETVSHWCIFHRKKTKQVVETWERQFHCSPRDQRVSFLYLANDILQNSRRKGLEFIDEFWKVLPDALNDVVQNGDELGRKAALRLVDIWEDRKVFGSHGQVLKEQLLKNLSGNGKSITYEMKPRASGDTIQKLISGYVQVNDGPVDEYAVFGKCRTAISFIEKLEKESGAEFNLGNIGGPGVLEELKGHYGFLRDSVEQLKLAESSRATLLSHLREAFHEQEHKIGHIRNQLQVAQSRYEQLGKLLSGQTVSRLPDQQPNEVPPPPPSSSFIEAPPPPDYPPDSPSVDMTLSTPPHYTEQQPQGPSVDTTYTQSTNEVYPKTSSAAEVAAKLMTSSSSAHMLSYVLSSLATEGVIGQSMNDDYLSDGNKRLRLHNSGLSSVPCYMPQTQQPAPPPFPHTGLFQPSPAPLPPTISRIPPPLPASVTASPQFGQTAGQMTNNRYMYGSPMPPSQLSPYPVVGVPPYPGPRNPYHNQGSDNGGLFNQQPLMAGPPPMSRQ